MITIWHNPRCSKSRQTLALVEERADNVTIRKYLEDAPTADEIRLVRDMLGLKAIEMMRVKEQAFKDLGLSKDNPEDALIAAMAEKPVLIERPIVINNGKAALGRPPEQVLNIL